MPWTDTYNGAFFLSIGTMLFAFLGLSVRYCYQSKCKDCSICFGLIHIIRDVDVELQEDKIHLEERKEDEK